MERTRRNVGDAIADAREERGEPVPELTLVRNTTLRAEGAASRSYEAMAEARADGSETLQVTARDPAPKPTRVWSAEAILASCCIGTRRDRNAFIVPSQRSRSLCRRSGSRCR